MPDRTDIADNGKERGLVVEVPRGTSKVARPNPEVPEQAHRLGADEQRRNISTIPGSQPLMARFTCDNGRFPRALAARRQEGSDPVAVSSQRYSLSGSKTSSGTTTSQVSHFACSRYSGSDASRLQVTTA